jgi:hypothetical protein
MAPLQLCFLEIFKFVGNFWSFVISKAGPRNKNGRRRRAAAPTHACARPRHRAHVASARCSGVRMHESLRCGPARASTAPRLPPRYAPRPGRPRGLAAGPAGHASCHARPQQASWPRHALWPAAASAASWDTRASAKTREAAACRCPYCPPLQVVAAAAEFRFPHQTTATRPALPLALASLHLSPSLLPLIAARNAGPPPARGQVAARRRGRLAGAATGRPRLPSAQTRSIAAPGAALRPSPAVAGRGFGRR